MSSVSGVAHAPADALEGVLREEMAPAFALDEIAAVARAIRFACVRHRVEPTLVLGMVSVESSFRRRRRSKVGARGLMQLLPATARDMALKSGEAWWGPRTLYDPVRNVRLGVQYLRWLKDRFPEFKALAAYCHGPRTVKVRPRPYLFRYARKVRRAQRHQRRQLSAWAKAQNTG